MARAKPDKQKPRHVCGDCIHLYACQSWNMGGMANTTADNCINFQKDDHIHAHWIFTKTEQYCSHCTAAIDSDDNADAFRFDYCPWCGAKMDEDGEG